MAASSEPGTVELDFEGLGYVGPRGPKGDPLTWDDLTDVQRASLRGEQGPAGADGRGIREIGADHDAVVTVTYTDGTSESFRELARVVEDAEAATAAANAAAARESWHVSGDTLVLGDSAYVSERRQALVLGRL